MDNWEDIIENAIDVEFKVHKYNSKSKINLADFLFNHIEAIVISAYTVVCAACAIGMINL